MDVTDTVWGEIIFVIRIIKICMNCICNLFKAWELLYVPPGLTFQNSTWCSHRIYVLCMELGTNGKFLPFTTLAGWFGITEVDIVYCSV